jgi:tetratricopeptide (TPR) repeat protein
VKRSASVILARKYLDRAQKLQGDNRHEQSIQWYRRALATDPSLAVMAYEKIGLMYVAQNRQEEAAGAFRQAIQARAEAGGRQGPMGSVHMHLGTLLGRMDKVKEAKEQLAQAVEEFRIELEENPDQVVVWERLGDTAAALGDFKGASEAFDKAVTLEPRHVPHYQKLARALEFQRRYDEAVAAIRKHMAIMKELGRRDAVAQLSQYIDLLEYKKVKQSQSK